MEVVNAIGRRKAAVARVFVSEGTGVITINKRDLAVYFPSSILQYVVKQPLNKLGVAEKYDIKVNLDGGGFKGQAEALRLAIARALVKINPEDIFLSKRKIKLILNIAQKLKIFHLSILKIVILKMFQTELFQQLLINIFRLLVYFLLYMEIYC
mgnify:CR=1 FL=1